MSRKKQFIYVLVVLALGMSSLAGCGGEPTPPPRVDESAPTAPPNGGQPGEDYPLPTPVPTIDAYADPAE
jgi:hypothetical protein